MATGGGSEKSDQEKIYFFFGAACDRAVREGWVDGRCERRRSWGCVMGDRPRWRR